MTIEQIAAVIGPPRFAVGALVRVYPQSAADDYEAPVGCPGTIEHVYVVDDRDLWEPAALDEADTDELGTVWYYGVDLHWQGPPSGGLYYDWELEERQ